MSKLFSQTESSTPAISSLDDLFTGKEEDLVPDSGVINLKEEAKSKEQLKALHDGIDALGDILGTPAGERDSLTKEKESKKSVIQDEKAKQQSKDQRSETQTPLKAPENKGKDGQEKTTNPKNSTSSGGMRFIPEPYPGAGKGVSNRFGQAWPALKAKLDALPVMSINSLKHLGPLTISTDHGKIELTAYVSLLTRFAARYYGDPAKPVYSAEVLRLIAYLQKSMMADTLASSDPKVKSFAGTIQELRLWHWIDAVASVVFDSSIIDNPEMLLDLGQGDITAMVTQLSECYHDGFIVYQTICSIVHHGVNSISPVEPFLMYDDEVGVYMDKYAKGTLAGGDVAVEIEPRQISASSSYSTADDDDQLKVDETPIDDLDVPEDEQEGEEAEASKLKKRKHSSDYGLSGRFRGIDLSAEAKRDKESVIRDTSKFVESLDIMEIKEKVEAVIVNQTEILKAVKALADKVESSAKRVDRSETIMQKALNEIASSITALVSQKSLAMLKDTTDSLNPTFGGGSNTRYSFNFSEGGKASREEKGKGVAMKASLSERLTKFNKSDCPELVTELKAVFERAGQPVMAKAVTEALLMDDFTRMNLANAVLKYQGF